MTIDTLKEFLFIFIFAVDLFLTIIFLHKYKSIKNKKIDNIIIFIGFFAFSIIKFLILFSIFRLAINPMDFIYKRGVVYVGTTYKQLFMVYKKNLLNNYVGIVVSQWIILLYYYWYKVYKKN